MHNVIRPKSLFLDKFLFADENMKIYNHDNDLHFIMFESTSNMIRMKLDVCPLTGRYQNGSIARGQGKGHNVKCLGLTT